MKLTAASRNSVINYPRHFSYLALVAVIEFVALWSIERWHPPFLDSFTAHLVLNGLFHSTALVLALTVRASRSRRVAFVAFTAVLGLVVYVLGINLEDLSNLSLGPAFPSAIGAAAYWYLVRLFWIRGLTALSLLRTVVLCAAVSVTWDKANNLVWFPDLLHLMEHTLCWWLAFSFSLYVSERGGARAQVAE
jgi:hypothetical protein